jgi:hypothetical protein
VARWGERAVGNRRLTEAELAAYEEMARAARRLKEAQRQAKAEAARRRKGESGARLSLNGRDGREDDHT